MAHKLAIASFFLFILSLGAAAVVLGIKSFALGSERGSFEVIPWPIWCSLLGSLLLFAASTSVAIIKQRSR